jgi:hypothetical protein
MRSFPSQRQKRPGERFSPALPNAELDRDKPLTVDGLFLRQSRREFLQEIALACGKRS